MTMKVFDARPCLLGEGPLWHPERQQLFWFDIVGSKLLGRKGDEAQEWQFAENVSAAGWTGRATLLIASETRLFEFNLDTGSQTNVCPLAADQPGLRSNDGRADPQGGFWIGTMAKTGHKGPGRIYRYYRGELRVLYEDIAIPNSICFSPDGTLAYYSDTIDGRIFAQPLDQQGWPRGEPRLFVNPRAEGLNPDGSVVAADGTLWNAQWGAARVAVYSPEGRLLDTVPVPGTHSSCPAFGGPDLTTLFCTSARQGLTDDQLAANPGEGQTFMIQTGVTGQAEHRVIL